MRRIAEIQPQAPNLPKKRWVRIMPDYSGKRHYNRWIQVYTALETEKIHYEYYGGYACLHLEEEYASKRFVHQIRELKVKSRPYDDEIRWLAPDSYCISCIIREPVQNTDDLVRKLHRLVTIFEEPLHAIFHSGPCMRDLTGPYTQPAPTFKPLSDETVSIHDLGIGDIFGLPLSIPDYQRIYCWENRQIESLWQSLHTLDGDTPYHLGTIILQNRQERYEIVDGQQRLVTLTLMLWGMGYTGSLPLLAERFRDSEAVRHVKHAKAVISTLLLSPASRGRLEAIVSSLRFSVIVINGGELDLCYTFFSNQNSKGVKLSDYDLLKAHHLRYITSEPQARHLAAAWTELSRKKERDDDNTGTMQIEASLGRHLYRLRRLLRKARFDEYGHYVRDEFQAAPVMADVPPFGERFDYFEPIQGGTHFFAFVSHFNERYDTFCRLPQATALHNRFSRRHGLYGDIAMTILFAYYLRFGRQYLSEALFCIMARLAEHRYAKARALEEQVHRFVSSTNLVQQIQFSTSPTFFLAAALGSIRSGVMDYEINDGIRWDFYKQLCKLFTTLDDFTVEEIKKRIDNEYR